MPITSEFDEPGRSLTPDDLYVLERHLKLAEKDTDGHRMRPVIGPESLLLMSGTSTDSSRRLRTNKWQRLVVLGQGDVSFERSEFRELERRILSHWCWCRMSNAMFRQRTVLRGQRIKERPRSTPSVAVN